MTTDQPAGMTARRWVKLALAAAVGVALLLGAAVAVALGALNAGAVAGPVQALLQAKLGRPVSFAHLAVSRVPEGLKLTFTDLRVGQPAKFGPGELLHAPQLVTVVRLAPLLAGRFEAPIIELTSPELHLRRRGPGENNYTFGKGGGTSGLLGATRMLSIVGGRLDMVDPRRELTFKGGFSHDPRSTDLPLRLEGEGSLQGEAYRVQAQGGPLNARKPREPHAARIVLQDGSMLVRLAGATRAPFDFRGLDMDVETQGQNLANLIYLFNVRAPNSPPFQLSGHMHREDKHFTLTRLRARIGQSDIEGVVDSQHLQRRRIEARLSARRITSRDLSVLLATPPPHAVARTKPGVPRRAGGTANESRLLSAAPISMRRLQGDDAVLHLHADHADGFGVPVNDANLNLSVINGRLAVAPLSFRTGGGRVKLEYRLDTRPKAPVARLTAQVRGVEMARVAAGRDFSGRLDADVEAQGAGASIAAQAATTNGRVTVRVTRGALSKRTVAALNGDVLRLIGASVSPGGKAALRCLAADFDIRSGVATASRLVVATDEGRATGGGRIDFRDERLDMRLEALSRGVGPPVQLRIPISIRGALLRPQVSGRAPSLATGVGDLFRSLRRAVGGEQRRPVATC